MIHPNILSPSFNTLFTYPSTTLAAVYPYPFLLRGGLNPSRSFPVDVKPRGLPVCWFVKYGLSILLGSLELAVRPRQYTKLGNTFLGSELGNIQQRQRGMRSCSPALQRPTATPSKAQVVRNDSGGWCMHHRVHFFERVAFRDLYINDVVSSRIYFAQSSYLCVDRRPLSLMNLATSAYV